MNPRPLDPTRLFHRPLFSIEMIRTSVKLLGELVDAIQPMDRGAALSMSLRITWVASPKSYPIQTTRDWN